MWQALGEKKHFFNRTLRPWYQNGLSFQIFPPSLKKISLNMEKFSTIKLIKKLLLLSLKGLQKDIGYLKLSNTKKRTDELRPPLS